MVREVAESCVDSLLTEMVASYCNRFFANKPELAARRIEAIGYQVGHQLSERSIGLFKHTLGIGHGQGTFVLQDNKFPWLERISIDPLTDKVNSAEDAATAENKATSTISMHLYYPCGIIRGALSNLGITCAVTADISNLPACSFVVRVKA
ncbi:hypothetical protein PIB30_019713 [Stylosanthes scabra]|uniref:Uncharacterized protein n=1 Tax=Stylosanthes scabra TaxID=79078 RepID=A0ABU6VAM4_9FABA|nr:hypothetical protein [Stylosanthes scabra]